MIAAPDLIAASTLVPSAAKYPIANYFNIY
jgi:hypothetical protein